MLPNNVGRSTRLTFSRESSRDLRWLEFEAWLRRWIWLGPFLFLIVIYLLANFYLPRVLQGGLNIYIAQPFLWLALTFLAYLAYLYAVKNRPTLTGSLGLSAISVGLFHVATLVIAGVLFGFGHSPYARSSLAVLGNMLYVVTMLLGVEFTRALLSGFLSNKSKYIALLVPTAVFAFLAIPLARFDLSGDPRRLLELGGETLLPALGENILATYLVMLGGPATAILYRGILLAFRWLSPVLPNLDPMTSAFVGTIAPVLGLILIESQLLMKRVDDNRDAATGKSNSAWSSIVGIVAVTLIWFNTGLFGIQPTIISGVSMEPEMVTGDVAITRNVPGSEIAVGDVIRYRLGDSYVLHRVVAIEGKASSRVFITKGDANNTEDAPVDASQLQGKVVAVVPKVGWIGVAARWLLSWVR